MIEQSFSGLTRFRGDCMGILPGVWYKITWEYCADLACLSRMLDSNRRYVPKKFNFISQLMFNSMIEQLLSSLTWFRGDWMGILSGFGTKSNNQRTAQI